MKHHILLWIFSVFLSAVSHAQTIESFNETGDDNTVLFRADPIYSADGVEPSGGNLFGNEPFCNGFVVAEVFKFGDVITNDQSGDGNFLFGGTLNTAASDFTGLVWGNLTPELVEPGISYVFSFYLTNLNEGSNLAIIQPLANGQPLGAGVSAVGSFQDGKDSQWQRFEFFWESNDQTAVSFDLQNVLVSGSGNDFGLDTIELTKVGDINCDGEIDLLDVAPFVSVLTGGNLTIKADINQDGVVDLLDVAPFVELLTGG